MDIFWQRIIRAVKLDFHLFEELKKDTQSMPQAISVVALSAFAAGVASISQLGAAGIFIVTAGGLVSWYIWAVLVYFIGSKLFLESQNQANLSEVLRTIGFSTSPGLIRVFGVINGLQQLIISLAAAWMLVAMVIAVKSVFGYKSPWKAVGVCLLAGVIQVVLLIFLFILFGGLKQI